MFKVMGEGVRSINHAQSDGRRASVMFKVMGEGWGALAMFKVMEGGCEGRKVQCDGWRASAMFEVMGGVSVMFKVIGARGVSHVQGDGREMWGAPVMFKVMGGVRGVGHAQCDRRGWGASAMFRVIGGVRGVSHVQGDGRGASAREGGGEGHSHTWEHWGCAAGQGAFLSFQLWHRVSFLTFQNWYRVPFWASNFGTSLFFADFSGYFQPNSTTIFSSHSRWPQRFRKQY